VNEFTGAGEELYRDKYQAGVPVKRIAREMVRLSCHSGRLFQDHGRRLTDADGTPTGRRGAVGTVLAGEVKYTAGWLEAAPGEPRRGG
jgi:hypothetical protein